VGQRAHFADAIALFNWAFQDLGIQGMVSVDAPYQPISARVTPSSLLVEAGPETIITPSEEGVTPVPPTTPGDSTTEVAGDVAVTRQPEPAPDSFLSTLTYWLGLATGAFDE
jgi:hypothetical protein